VSLLPSQLQVLRIEAVPFDQSTRVLMEDPFGKFRAGDGHKTQTAGAKARIYFAGFTRR
jgi:hypothetical protein